MVVHNNICIFFSRAMTYRPLHTCNHCDNFECGGLSWRQNIANTLFLLKWINETQILVNMWVHSLFLMILSVQSLCLIVFNQSHLRLLWVKKRYNFTFCFCFCVFGTKKHNTHNKKTVSQVAATVFASNFYLFCLQLMSWHHSDIGHEGV